MLNFTTNKNYMKRFMSGTEVIAAPSVVQPWFNYMNSTTIVHGLGYIPVVRIYYEPFNDGRIFPASGSRVSASGIGIPFNDIVCLFEVTDNVVTVYLESASSETGTRPIYYVIYLDKAV